MLAGSPGHAATAITLDRYGHLLSDDAESAVERLDGYLAAEYGSTKPIAATGAAGFEARSPLYGELQWRYSGLRVPCSMA